QDRAALSRKIRHRARGVESSVRRNGGGAEIQDRRGGTIARTRAQRVDGFERDETARSRRRDLANAEKRTSHLYAYHERAREGQGDFRPLARLQGHRRRPPPFQSRRARIGRGAGLGRARLVPAAFASLLQAEGEVVRERETRILGSQRTAAEIRD